MELEYVKFNLNKMVKVKLTNFGIRIYKNSFTKYGLKEPKIIIDNDGYTKFQLWYLMQIFGEYMGMCKELPFEMDIKIETN